MINKKKNILFLFVLSIVLIQQLLSACHNTEAKNKSIAVEDADLNRLQLGRYLFYDRRLSVNFTRSCGTCHNPDFAFTDGYKRSLGAFADLHQRNTEPLFNLGRLKYFTAADSSIHSPLQQMNNPLFSDHPVELGVSGHEQEILDRIAADPLYKALFYKSFPPEPSINWVNIKTAIARFLLSIRSQHSSYDQYKSGDSTALSASQQRGMQLFFSSRLKCASCHGGFNFSTPSITNSNGDTLFYFNTGLYDIDGKGAYPAYDEGLYQHTKNAVDRGKFRVPTLRNLAFTAPYYHDGSAASLWEVVEAYQHGGRKILKGLYAGNGSKNRYKSNLITGFDLSDEGRHDLVNFLLSLSDTTLVNDAAVRNPFSEDETKKKY